MTSREQRIRALAASMATQRDAASLLWTAEACIASAARIVDAIDALPVPGQRCEECDSAGEHHVFCGTGRQESDNGD